MIEMMLAQVFLEAGALCLILYLVARHEADYSFAKVAMVTAGIIAGSLLLQALLMDYLGPWTVLPILAFVTFMVMTFCWVSFWKSVLVVILFAGFHALLTLGVNAARARIDRHVAESLPVGDDDLRAAQEFLEEVGQVLATQAVQEAQAAAEARSREGESTSAATLSLSHPAAPRLPPEGSANWAKARSLLRVDGIMGSQAAGRMAMINGQHVEEGDVVSVQQEDKVYRWRVGRIREGSVDLEPIDTQAPADRL